MARLMWWVLVGALIWWGLYKKFKSPPTTSHEQPKPDNNLSPSVMVACAHCGLHLPIEDATSISTGQSPLFFCSVSHAQQHARENN
jgi:uncharacterized protein